MGDQQPLIDKLLVQAGGHQAVVVLLICHVYLAEQPASREIQETTGVAKRSSQWRILSFWFFRRHYSLSDRSLEKIPRKNESNFFQKFLNKNRLPTSEARINCRIKLPEP